MYAQALGLTRALGDHETTAVALLNLALVAVARASPLTAITLLIEALQISDSIGSRLAGANVLAVTAGVAALHENWGLAAWFLGAAQAQMKETGQHPDPIDAVVLDPLAKRTRESLTREMFSANEADGRSAAYADATSKAREWLFNH